MTKLAWIIYAFLFNAPIFAQVKHQDGGKGGQVNESPCDFFRRQVKKGGNNGSNKVNVRGGAASVELLDDGGINLTVPRRLRSNLTWELVPAEKKSYKISDDAKPYGDNKNWFYSELSKPNIPASDPHYFSNRFAAMKSALTEIQKAPGDDNDMQKAALRCASDMMDNVQTSE